MPAATATTEQAVLRGRSTRVGRGGVVFIVVTILFAIGAINGQNNLLYFLFGVSIASLLIGGLIGGTAMMGLRVARTRVTPARAGAPFFIQYRITNRGRWLAIFGLVIEEHIGASAQPLRSNAPPEQVRAVPLAPIRAFLARVPPRDTASARAEVTTESRGTITLTRFSVVTCFPFGLIEKRVHFEQRTHITVLPAAIQLRPGLVPLPRATVTEAAETAHRVGTGSEFLATREYTPGDPLRTIAWRLTARTGSPVVRMTADEAGAHLRLILSPGIASSIAPGSLADHRLAAIASALIDQYVAIGMVIELIEGSRSTLIVPTAEARDRAQRHLATAVFKPPALGTGLSERPAIVVGVPLSAPGLVASHTLVPGEIASMLRDGHRLPDVLDPEWHERRTPAGGDRDWRRFLPTWGTISVAPRRELDTTPTRADAEPAT